MDTLSSREEDSIQAFIRKAVTDADIGHAYDHIEAVVNLAKRIGKEEKANIRIVVPAAYFHDAVHRQKSSFADHTKASAETAVIFLKKIGFSKQELEHIKEVILSSDYGAYEKGILPLSVEAKVVRDADWLEAIGHRGIAREFAFSGYYKVKELGKVLWNPENPTKLKRYGDKPDPTAIYHFFSKLLWIKDNMQTSFGKKLAEKRHKAMVDFLKAYKEEMDGLR